MFLLICISLAILLDFIFYLIYFYCNYAHLPLNIKTFDGSNQPYHPSVLFFEKGWNGYKYWMVVTPYPMHVVYKDRWECPSIYVSNNGINWDVPAGLVNPIDDLSQQDIQAKNFFSDPHLVFKDGLLECWYRITIKTKEDTNTILLRKRTIDGINWSNREIIADPKNPLTYKVLGDMVRSQSVLYYKGKYHMWYVDNKDNIGQRNVCYSYSEDTISWNDRITCTLTGKIINPWHIDLTIIESTFYLTIYDLCNLTLWESNDGQTFYFCKEILNPSLVYGSFYSDGLYRSSLIKDNNGYKLYFSAFDEKRTSIGLLEGKEINELKITNTKKTIPIQDFISIYCNNRRRSLYKLKLKIQKLLK